jgi:hypothetical protein
MISKCTTGCPMNSPPFAACVAVHCLACLQIGVIRSSRGEWHRRIVRELGPGGLGVRPVRRVRLVGVEPRARGRQRLMCLCRVRCPTKSDVGDRRGRARRPVEFYPDQAWPRGADAPPVTVCAPRVSAPSTTRLVPLVKLDTVLARTRRCGDTRVPRIGGGGAAIAPTSHRHRAWN